MKEYFGQYVIREC